MWYCTGIKWTYDNSTNKTSVLLIDSYYDRHFSNLDTRAATRALPASCVWYCSLSTLQVDVRHICRRRLNNEELFDGRRLESSYASRPEDWNDTRTSPAPQDRNHIRLARMFQLPLLLSRRDKLDKPTNALLTVVYSRHPARNCGRRWQTCDISFWVGHKERWRLSVEPLVRPRFGLLAGRFPARPVPPLSLCVGRSRIA